MAKTYWSLAGLRGKARARARIDEGEALVAILSRCFYLLGAPAHLRDNLSEPLLQRLRV